MNQFNAIWFSRHQPTEPQMDPFLYGGKEYQICPSSVLLGQVFGSTEILDQRLVRRVSKELRDAADGRAICGVFAAPLLEALISETSASNGSEKMFVPIFSAWNINRAPEGASPQFEHQKWCLVGHYAI